MNMVRSLSITLIALSGLFVASLGTSPAHAASYAPYTCQGGPIASGDYGPMTIAAACFVPDGNTVTVHGNMTIRSSAEFYASSQNESVSILGSVYMGTNSGMFFGCSYDSGCSYPFPYNSINGSILATSATGIVLAGADVYGGVTQTGGGGGQNCNGNPLFFGGPAFSTIADSYVGGQVQIRGLHTCWFGVDNSYIGLTMTVSNNLSADPDSTEIGANLIGGNLSCVGNLPTAHLGEFYPADQSNYAEGSKLGQCAGL